MKVGVNLDEKNHFFFNKLRREIMLENCYSVPLSSIIELSMSELKKNNTPQQIKEKTVRYCRIKSLRNK